MIILMPEPVAWVRRHPDGALTAEFLEDAVIEPVRKQSGAWIPMITTTQAEAYADAKVREALEEVLLVLEQICEADRQGACEAIAMEAISDIRALIPKEHS